MPSSPQVGGLVVRDYCQRFPAAASLTLARMLVRDHPELFASVELARHRVRYYRGRLGKAERRRCKRGSGIIPRIPIPKPEPTSFEPYVLPEGVGRWLLLADLHVPFHDDAALKVALAYGQNSGCDGVIVLGDFLDCYQLSSFCRDPRVADFGAEIEAADAILEVITDTLRPRAIFWREANHEYRLTRYMMLRAPELLAWTEPVFSFPAFLHLAERQITWVARTRPLHYHALTLIHGDEWRGGGYVPVNPARSAYLRGKSCIIVGHSHRSSEHTETDLRGGIVTCWSLGCLCNLHPEYAPLTVWNHGFAILDTRGPTWNVQNKRIIRGEVV